MSGRVLFYVQHLLGIGHLKRAATLARAMAGEGLSVTLVSGGDNVPILDTSGFDFVQLPPVRASDRSFRDLIDELGDSVNADYLARRRTMLVECCTRIRPQILVTEMFPFGRRVLRDEFLALIEVAKAGGSKIVCSVRDILVEKGRPEREAEMVDIARRRFDAILVHGDPTLIAFNATFPRADELADLIRYTGYVTERDLGHGGAAGRGEVLVSAGSSATGEVLLRTAMDARAESSLADVRWRLLVGHALAGDAFAAIRRGAPDGVTVERARPDFATLLRNCILSISQGGYNTMMDVLTTGVRAIVVPYAGGRETEQTVRARLLAERGLIRHCPQRDLSVPVLVDLIEQARAARPLPHAGIDLDGARKSAKIVAALLAPALQPAVWTSKPNRLGSDRSEG